MHALSPRRPLALAALGAALAVLWTGCAAQQRADAPPPPTKLRQACLEDTSLACSDALTRARRGELEATEAEQFWVTQLLTTSDLRARAARELKLYAAELHPKSLAAGALEDACFKGDLASCRHLAQTDRDAERPFWGAMACKHGDVDACLALAPTPEAFLGLPRAGCTLKHRAECWDHAQTRASAARRLQNACDAGDDATCWGLIAQRINTSAPVDDAVLARAERACACNAVMLPSGAAYHAAMRTHCARVDAARNTARLRARFLDGLARCVEGDAEACEPAAALALDAPAVVSEPATIARKLAAALRTRGCRAGDAHACWELKRYDAATPALERACAAGDPRACGKLGAQLAHDRATAPEGRAMLRDACAARDYAACHRYALAARASITPRAAQDDPVRRLEDITRLLHTCATSPDNARTCAFVGETLLRGQDPLPPSPAHAAPALERACALGDLASCGALTGDAKLPTLRIACLLHDAPSCDAYARAVATAHPDDAARAWGRACRLGDHDACPLANLPLAVACLEGTPTTRLRACLAACEEGDRTSCAHVSRALGSRPQVFRIVPQGDTYRLGQRIADALGASCARGSALDCYAQATLIRGGHNDGRVSDALRHLQRLDQLNPSTLMQLTAQRAHCKQPGAGRECDHPLLYLADPAAAARWRALTDDAAQRAARIERDALDRAERGCASGAHAACAEVALLALHQLTHVEGKHPKQDPDRWRDAYAKLDAACTADALVACQSLTQLPRGGSPDPEALFTRATERLCGLDDAHGCLLRAAHAARAQTPNAQRAAWFARACDLRSAEGCAQAAALWARGDGLARDDARADTLYARACALGVQDACYTPSWSACADALRVR